MHVDRLRIQHALMEENPEITVCTSWLTPFGEGIANGCADGAGAGIVDRPLLRLLERNVFFNPTSIMRREFIRHIGLKYKYYDYAEDYNGGSTWPRREPCFISTRNRYSIIAYRINRSARNIASNSMRAPCVYGARYWTYSRRETPSVVPNLNRCASH